MCYEINTTEGLQSGTTSKKLKSCCWMSLMITMKFRKEIVSNKTKNISR